ncbi:hypothetical protein CTI12_AA394030 [Artemisia annua]|uniref:Uncharacterized protein n=1 Tax=Artemisia annua TaxID=35608 RepID=A0A2U1MCT6_ARTAN|nr:hypothetical protein CTI12_AA394030 [Artemisia annua]
MAGVHRRSRNRGGKRNENQVIQVEAVIVLYSKRFFRDAAKGKKIHWGMAAVIVLQCSACGSLFLYGRHLKK